MEKEYNTPEELIDEIYVELLNDINNRYKNNSPYYVMSKEEIKELIDFSVRITGARFVRWIKEDTDEFVEAIKSIKQT